MRPRSLRWLIPLTLVVLLLPACGDSADDGAGTTLASTTTTVETTSTTEAPSTTTMPTTTTTEAEDEEAWVDGDTVLIRGDCFIEIGKTDDETTHAKVSCDEPHLGEVIATGPTLCPMELDANDFTEAVSQYIGVGYSSTRDWMDEHGITGASAINFKQEEEGVHIVTMCYLAVEEGDLTRSYRSD